MAHNVIPITKSQAVTGGSGIDGGGDGPHNTDMLEKRVEQLELGHKELMAELKGIRSDLTGIRVDLSELKGRVATLPTSIQLIGFVLAVLAIAGLSKYFSFH